MTSPRSTLLVILLPVTVALAALLAYEAHDASRSERVTAERALRDYASVAAWEFVADAKERLEREVSGALAPVTGGKAASPYELLAPPELLRASASTTLPCDGRSTDSARVYFRLDLRDGALSTAGAGVPPALAAWLRDTVTAHTRTRYQPNTRYAAIVVPERTAHGVVLYGIKFAQHGAPLAAFGFVACPSAFDAVLFRRVMADHPLLPSSVTGGALNDSLLAVDVRDAAGRQWFTSAVRESSPFVGEVAFDAVGDLVARATLRPSAAERLLVGRPLRSRLPVLLGLLTLTAALAVIALFQLRREHELARLRADFTSSVSHELRTPLAQILLYGETLSYGRVRSDEERRLAAETIVQEARRLMHMVENVLHFSRSREKRSRVMPQATALAPLGQSIVAAFAPLAAEQHVTVRTSLDDRVVAIVDPGAFRQIMLNLLDNAVKYGAPGKTVSVSVLDSRGRARLEVEDEGRGIPPQDRERIWNPYVRLRRDMRSAGGGSGIGLAVVRELTRLHGGDAWVEIGGRGGARFIVELPMAKRHEVVDRPSNGAAPTGVAARSEQEVGS